MLQKFDTSSKTEITMIKTQFFSEKNIGKNTEKGYVNKELHCLLRTQPTDP